MKQMVPAIVQSSLHIRGLVWDSEENISPYDAPTLWLLQLLWQGAHHRRFILISWYFLQFAIGKYSISLVALHILLRRVLPPFFSFMPCFVCSTKCVLMIFFPSLSRFWWRSWFTAYKFLWFQPSVCVMIIKVTRMNGVSVSPDIFFLFTNLWCTNYLTYSVDLGNHPTNKACSPCSFFWKSHCRMLMASYSL